MKMTELKCTACNGTLKFDENNPNIAVCEYCHTRYVIEDAGSDHARLETPPPAWYTPQNSTGPASGTPGVSSKPKDNGWGPYGWKRAVALVAFGLIAVFLINMRGLINRWNMDHPKKEDLAMFQSMAEEASDDMEYSGQDAQTAPDTPFSGAFAMMAEAAYGKPADSISEQELAKIQWIATKFTDMGSVLAVGYSYDDPYTSEDAELTWVPLSRDAAKQDTSQLARFTGLKKLDLSGSVSPGDLRGLPIQGISCYSDSPAELAELLGDEAAQLKEVNITAGLESLDGLAQLPGVEKLSLYCGHLTDISMLANAKQVTSLTLESCDGVTDFSVLSVMPWLKELSIESEGLRDIGFVSKMPELTSLSLYDTSILHINGLAGNTSLTSLSIDRCGEMTDCSAVSGLTGLKTLFLDIPYGCGEPDLSGLTGLTELTISGVEHVDFLRNMSQLETLTLDGCQINDTGAFAGLTGLKKLKCTYVYGDLTSWNFVTGIPGLEILDLSGASTYEDISSLFLVPTLKELYLNGMECELNFSKLAVNESLTTLEMDGMKFYTNVQISGGGGIYSIDYDNVSLDEHTDFLTNYPNLKYLSLAENTLTQIGFASSLGALETLDISGNYVTDLKPLETLKALKMVNSTGNPVENYRVLGEDVLILK